MFFLVTHTWDVANEEQVSKEMIKLFFDCHYGLVGNPWPKLFFAWHHPKKPEMTALWESSNPEMLLDVFKERKSFTTEITHVRQLYPPHVGCYNLMKIRTNRDPSPK